MNVFSMLKNMKEMQSQLSNIEAEGCAGGDMVRVVLDGKFEPKKVEISAQAMEKGDPNFIADLVLAAITDANKKVQRELQKKMSSLGGGALAQSILGK